MDKKLLKQLRSMKVKEKEITFEEKQKIKEYLDGKRYTLEKLELLKIEMQFQKDKKYSIIFPVVLSIFATFIFEIAKEILEWWKNFVFNELPTQEAYNLVKRAIELHGIVGGEDRLQIISGIIQIFLGYSILVACFIMLAFAFIIFIWLFLYLLGEGLHEKDKVYQYYYGEYLDEKINQLKCEKK